MMIRLRNAAGRVFAGIGVLMLGACAQLPHKNVVDIPTSSPIQAPPPTSANGSIFEASYSKPLFSDRRPSRVGDVLTIILDEDVSASKSSQANASRDGSIGLELTKIPKALKGLLTGQSTDVSGSNKFSGSGDADASNNFVGTITVTVVNVLPNGNLRIAGDKRIGINQGVENIRFSGIVNPRMISAESTIKSNKVANARMEYYGDGFIDEAQHMGWAQRLLLNIAPF